MTIPKPTTPPPAATAGDSSGDTEAAKQQKTVSVSTGESARWHALDVTFCADGGAMQV